MVTSMARRGLVGLTLVSLMILAVGQLLKRLLPSHGDEASATFARPAIMGGDNFRSAAAPLNSGGVTVLMGGAYVDLRDAQPAAGATLEVFVKAGAARVEVPETWSVVLDAITVLGEAPRPASQLAHR